jgi:hypothetical protein
MRRTGRHRVRAGMAVAALALVATTASPAGALAAAQHPGASVSRTAAPKNVALAAVHKTYYPQGQDAQAPVYRPRTLIIFPDGSFGVRPVRWSHWTVKRAEGRGTARADNCQPNCAQGHYRKDPVTVTLYKPRTVCGKRFFTAVRLHYTGKLPPGLKTRNSTFDVDPICSF